MSLSIHIICPVNVFTCERTTRYTITLFEIKVLCLLVNLVNADGFVRCIEQDLVQNSIFLNVLSWGVSYAEYIWP